ncbi:MAG: tetratricopeptide repeat protein [Bacteroidia bacterium]
MNLEDDKLHQIEKYIEGRLTQSEILEFEAQLENDPEFQSFIKSVTKPISSPYARFVSRLQIWLRHKRRFVRRLKKEPFTAQEKYWALATSIIVIMLTTGIWFSGTLISTHKGETLFNEHFSVYHNAIDLNSASYELVNAVENYDEANFNEATHFFLVQLINEPGDYVSEFYLGVSRLASEKPLMAEKSFKKVLKMSNGQFKDPAQWYLALCSLKTGKLKEARQQLQEISSDKQHGYSFKARMLLKEFK